MPNTTNFNWATPADTDLVKDGAAAIRTLGNSIDSSFVDLKGGTTGQILSKASNTDLDFTFVTPNVGDITEVQAGTGISVASGTGPVPVVTNSMATEITAKGDLIVGTGSGTFDNLPAGTNGYTLVADSAETTGLKWAAASSPSFVGWSAYLTSATLAITTATGTSVGMDAEDLDTDGFHSNVTNNSRFTIPTGKGGKYLITVGVQWAATGSTATKETGLRKNGTALFANLFNLATINPNTFSYILDLVATDYIEVYVYHNLGSNANLNGSNAGNGKITYCHGTYLGA